jgi:hypothetical protein
MDCGEITILRAKMLGEVSSESVTVRFAGKHCVYGHTEDAIAEHRHKLALAESWSIVRGNGRNLPA